MKTIILSAILSFGLAATSVLAQAPADSVKGRVFFTNRLMRQVIIPANNPENPDLIPVGYEAQMPGTTGVRVARPGDHFWRFTTELVNRHNLYDEWVSAGRPEPVGDFARERVPEEEMIAARDTAQAATTPAAEEPPEAEPEEAETGGISPLLWIGLLVLVVLLVAAFLWRRRQQSREEETA